MKSSSARGWVDSNGRKIEGRFVQTVFFDIFISKRPLPELVLGPVAISKPKTRMAGSSPATGSSDRGISTAVVPALLRDRSALLEWRLPDVQLLRILDRVGDP
jgi:hypothetical protein